MAIAVLVATLKALVVLSILILLIGMIKPKWILFWMKEPSRLLVSSIALILFMGSMTGYSQLMVKPKAKTEREKSEKGRNRDEMNDLDLGPSVKH